MLQQRLAGLQDVRCRAESVRAYSQGLGQCKAGSMRAYSQGLGAGFGTGEQARGWTSSYLPNFRHMLRQQLPGLQPGCPLQGKFCASVQSGAGGGVGPGGIGSGM